MSHSPTSGGSFHYHNRSSGPPHHTLSATMRALRAREEQEGFLYASDDSDLETGSLHSSFLGSRRLRRSRVSSRVSTVSATATLIAGEENGSHRRQSSDEEVIAPDPWANLPVWMTVQRVRRLILASIEDPYTLDQLKEPRINVLIVKPLVERLFDKDDVSVVYCLLVNRLQFLREESFQFNHLTVNITRANLCELVATKILRRHDEVLEGRKGLLQLANILVAGFGPFQNAPPEVIKKSRHALNWAIQKRGGYERKLTALEVAIISESKAFLSSAACQKVVDGVYWGRIVYTPTSFIDILPDHYKHKGISLYNPHKAPLLNQYRLIVPRLRNFLELCQFLILLVLYYFCMTSRNHSRMTAQEVIFCIYAAGWTLDEFASILEHGWTVHTQNLWSFLDITFVVIFGVYFGMRMHGLATLNPNQGRQALDILSIAAPVLVPRLAFCLMPENMLFISLRAMVADYLVLTMLAVWCFAGFLIAMTWLSLGHTLSHAAGPNGTLDSAAAQTHPQPSAMTVTLWMLWIWFGLDGTGIEASSGFHPQLGPVLMVLFAFFGNTLFLTVLVSILTTTFSKIAADASAEIQFRRAVLTFEGVKSDAIFAYRPPFNLLALVILLPAKFFLSPRVFHYINVAAVRILNAPFLLLITLYERRFLWKQRPRPTSGLATEGGFWAWWEGISASSFSVHGDLHAVFEVAPPREVIMQIENEDDFQGAALENSFAGMKEWRLSCAGLDLDENGPRKRRFSSIVE